MRFGRLSRQLEQLQMGWQKLREIKKPAKRDFSRFLFLFGNEKPRVSRA